ARALQSTRAHGQQRTRQGEGRAHVRASADRAQEQIGAYVPIHPLEAAHRERRAGAADAAERAEIVVLGLDARLLAREQKRRARPEIGDLLPLRHAPEDVEIRVTRASVIEDESAPDEEPPDEEVPHHPAGRGVPKEAIARPEIAME